MVFNFIPFLIQLLIAVAVAVVSYLIMPKPKVAKPAAAQDMDDPTIEMGRPIPVIFGTVTVKGLQIMGFWDKLKTEREIST